MGNGWAWHGPARSGLAGKVVKRKSLTFKQKLASALLRIKDSSGAWLISSPLRDNGTAEEICGAVQFDHIVLDCFEDDKTWSNRPQNIDPVLTAEHREKSREDTRKAAKVKRLLKKHVAAAAREEEEMLARRRKILSTSEAIVRDQGKRRWPKRKMQSRGQFHNAK